MTGSTLHAIAINENVHITDDFMECDSPAQFFDNLLDFDLARIINVKGSRWLVGDRVRNCFFADSMAQKLPTFSLVYVIPDDCNLSLKHFVTDYCMWNHPQLKKKIKQVNTAQEFFGFLWHPGDVSVERNKYGNRWIKARRGGKIYLKIQARDSQFFHSVFDRCDFLDSHRCWVDSDGEIYDCFYR